MYLNTRTGAGSLVSDRVWLMQHFADIEVVLKKGKGKSGDSLGWVLRKA